MLINQSYNYNWMVKISHLLQPSKDASSSIASPFIIIKDFRKSSLLKKQKMNRKRKQLQAKMIIMQA